METLVAADSLLNMDCADTLSLEEHYCKWLTFVVTITMFFFFNQTAFYNKNIFSNIYL